MPSGRHAAALLEPHEDASSQDLDIVVSGPPVSSPLRRRLPILIIALVATVACVVATWMGVLLPLLIVSVLVVGVVLLMPQLLNVLEEKRSREEREGAAMADWFADLRTSGTWNDDAAPARARTRTRSPGRHRADA